ncbi:hypothetical protein ACOMHN_006634 [Nucella lapillus]
MVKMVKMIKCSDYFGEAPSAESLPLTDPHKSEAGCPDTHFQCPGGGYCLPVFLLCNAVHDCQGKEDEAQCDDYQCPGYYRCRQSRVCLHPSHMCDGHAQCPQKDDELLCQMRCPQKCVCRGLAFNCGQPFEAAAYPDIRYLDASGSGVGPENLKQNIMLVRVVNKSKQAWSSVSDILVTHLAACDLVMGIYLAVVTVPDQVYQGSYVWRDTAWRHSVWCRLSGFLFVLSTDVSAFLVRSAGVCSGLDQWCGSVVWISGVLLAAIPLTPQASQWELYSRTGLCQPLIPLLLHNSAHTVYARGAVVCLILALAVKFLVGQIYLMNNVRVQSNIMLSLKTNQTYPRGVILARQHRTVLMFDGLCGSWLGIVVLLASTEVPVSLHVQLGTVLLTVPLKSALHPFLWLLAHLQENQRLTHRRRLLKRLGALSSTDTPRT